MAGGRHRGLSRGLDLSRWRAAHLFVAILAVGITPAAPMVTASAATRSMPQGRPSVPLELRRQHRVAEEDQEEITKLASRLQECQQETSAHLQELKKLNDDMERTAHLLSNASTKGMLDEGTLEERLKSLEDILVLALNPEEGLIDEGGDEVMEIGSTPVGLQSRRAAWQGGAGLAEGSMGLRGGGGATDVGCITLKGGSFATATGLDGTTDAGCITLRGGGNAPSYPSSVKEYSQFSPAKTKYTGAEHKLNKQMCKAVTGGKEDEVKRLLREGADPSYPHCGMLEFSVLHHAVNIKNARMVDILVSHGGNVKQRCALGWTLLHQAAYNGDLDMCQKLMNLGVDITVMNNARRTPPQVAKTNGQKECAKALWKIQELAEQKKGGHAPKGEPTDDDDDEVDEEDSTKEREEEEAAKAAEEAKKAKKKR